MDPELEILLQHRAAKDVDEFVEAAFPSGMEPSAEARKPVFASPVVLCGAIGFVAGGILAAALALTVAADHGILRASLPGAILRSGLLGGFLGGALGATLRAFDDALWILPRGVGLVIGAAFGAAAGCITLAWPTVPHLEAIGAGAGLGVVLALLFRVFASRLP